MPEHGEERNARHWQEAAVTDFVDATTGEPDRLPYVAHSGSRAERYCSTCGAWIAIGAGLNGGLLGFILCPTCGTEWRPS